MVNISHIAARPPGRTMINLAILDTKTICHGSGSAFSAGMNGATCQWESRPNWLPFPKLFLVLRHNWPIRYGNFGVVIYSGGVGVLEMREIIKYLIESCQKSMSGASCWNAGIWAAPWAHFLHPSKNNKDNFQGAFSTRSSAKAVKDSPIYCYVICWQHVKHFRINTKNKMSRATFVVALCLSIESLQWSENWYFPHELFLWGFVRITA